MISYNVLHRASKQVCFDAMWLVAFFLLSKLRYNDGILKSTFRRSENTLYAMGSNQWILSVKFSIIIISIFWLEMEGLTTLWSIPIQFKSHQSMRSQVWTNLHRMNLLCISSAQLNETIWYEKESTMPLCMVIGIKVQTTLTMRKCASLRLSQSNALKHNELKKISQNRVWRRHAHITKE